MDAISTEVAQAIQKHSNLVRRKTCLSKLGSGVYKNIGSSLNEYDTKLFGSTGSIQTLITSVYRDLSPVNILIFGCGKNTMARDLLKTLDEGHKEIVSITGMSNGDPRTKVEKSDDDASGIQFVDKDIMSYSFPDDSFDVIFSKDTFVHLIDPLSALNKLYCSLRIDGRIYADFNCDQLATCLQPQLCEGMGPDIYVPDDDTVNSWVTHIVTTTRNYLGIDNFSLDGRLFLRKPKGVSELRFPNVAYSSRSTWGEEYSGIYQFVPEPRSY